jgi:hypothetical protein
VNSVSKSTLANAESFILTTSISRVLGVYLVEYSDPDKVEATYYPIYVRRHLNQQYQSAQTVDFYYINDSLVKITSLSTLQSITVYYIN